MIAIGDRMMINAPTGRGLGVKIVDVETGADITRAVNAFTLHAEPGSLITADIRVFTGFTGIVTVAKVVEEAFGPALADLARLGSFLVGLLFAALVWTLA